MADLDAGPGGLHLLRHEGGGTDQGDLKRAISEMERVSRMFPDFTEGLVPLGSFYMEAQETLKAIQLFRTVTARDPSNPEAWYF